MALPILDGNQSATTLSTILAGGEHTPAHTVVSLGSTAISNITSAVSGSVVSISNFPSTQTIAGTVTANPTGTQTVAGTVTANLQAQKFFSSSSVTANRSIIGYSSAGGGIFNEWDGSVDAEVVINGSKWSTANPAPVSVSNNISGTVTVGNSVTIGSLPAISGTVTVGAMPSGSLTTRFGSVTTANTAELTSAVTNASRKYLLIQNVTTGSNVITVGIGFTPTTTQGIQLTAGAGITFESSYIPTSAVYILSSVTASNFTILEA